MKSPEADKEKEEAPLLRAEILRLRKILRELTPPLPALLRRRGFRVYRKEPSGDLFVPRGELIDSYYEMLKKYSFRLFLRDVIRQQPAFSPAQVTRYATKEVTGEYLRYLADMGMVRPEGDTYCLTGERIKSFGETLEWFVAEVFKREFAAEALWGVKVKRPLVGGDYDLLAKIDGSILYMEIKSSPPRQIYQKEVGSFLERVGDLLPEIAVFFVDTELRMKDKIVPFFEEELAKKTQGTAAVRRMEKELFEVVTGGTETPRMFIINAKDSIVNNIEKVLTAFFRRSR
ncbi:MAG: hypothetical protein K8I29_15530 [Alphaproteobacteria bacterium]|uniref:Uncharacterized protein n=1 Tax=Candidatus Nitrobium versatile TaxID=2884831 RepID=A0A953M130_9BACT|nr:hypothetical protein [Candidatus Nitrobium versatile]